MSAASGITLVKTEQTTPDRCGYQTADQSAGFDSVRVSYYTVAAADEFDVASKLPGAKPVSGIGSKAVAGFDGAVGYELTVLLADGRGFLVTVDRNQPDTTQVIAARIVAAAS